MLNIKSTDFDSLMDDMTKEEKGSSCHGFYDFYGNFTVYNKIIINDQIELSANYQTGGNFLYNDYNCPDPDLSLADEDGGTSGVLVLINGLMQSDFEKETITESLEEIKELCSVIDTVEKLEKVYEFLNDNLPVLDDYLTEEHKQMAYTE